MNRLHSNIETLTRLHPQCWASGVAVALCATPRWWLVLVSIVLLLPAVARAQWPTNGVLDLATAARVALADNPSLYAAQARIEQARARLMQARAAYWPTLSGSASYARVEPAAGQAAAPLAATVGTDPYLAAAVGTDRYLADLEAGWLLFDGFARRSRVTSARAGRDQSREAMLDVRRNLLESLGQAYYGVQLARENVVIAEADEAYNRRLLEEAQARQRAGDRLAE